MKIVIAGGSGFIGQALIRELAPTEEVVVLSRDPGKVTSGRGVRWNPRETSGAWIDELATADGVVNLAGASIADGRWTKERKAELLASRVESTRAIVSAFRRDPRERVLVNASAIGFYGNRGEEILTEESKSGADFLASLSEKWEEEARRAEDVARVVILRFGIVLDEAGGALQKTLTPFRLGAGGVLGSGEQYWSWIDLHDVVRMIRWAIEQRNASGVINATAPAPVTNREFTRLLARALHRPAVIPAPGFALRIAFGEMADALLLSSQRVFPARAEELRFEFRYPTLESSLRRILG